MVSFFGTWLERGLNVLRLLDPAGGVLLELRGSEIDDAIQAGFVDPNDCHRSMYEYARMRNLLAASQHDASAKRHNASAPKSRKIPSS